MKTIHEIHRENLSALVRQYGSVAAVAAAVECSPSQFSQWLNASENSGTGKPRGIGSASCRRVEKATGKPNGWMDKDHPDEISAQLQVVPPVRREPRMTLAYDDEMDLLDLYRRTDERGRRVMLNSGSIEAARTAAEDSGRNKG